MDYLNIYEGKQPNQLLAENFYVLLCEDIIKERLKLGGNWVINQAVYTRKSRDVIRDIFGEEFKFVILLMDPELQAQRLGKRCTIGFGEAGKLSGEVSEDAMEEAKKEMTKFTKGFEAVQPDEPNTLALNITEDKSVKDVADKIMEFVD